MAKGNNFKGFRKFITKVKQFEAPQELEEVLVVESKDIVNAIKIQLSRGIDGNGENVYLTRPIGGPKFYSYAKRTIQRKDMFGAGLGSVVNHVTNYMNGGFYNSIFVETFSDGSWQVQSNSPLIGLIRERSGPSIINLSPESTRFLFEERMAPLLQEEINELFYDV
jgi:hypothetical protein